MARVLRSVYRGLRSFSLPAPAIAVRPLLALFLISRGLFYFFVRVFVCEPLFKAYCTKVGRRVRTGEHIHWVSGGGRLIIGDDVLLDGKSSFMFARRYADNPTLSIGCHTIVSGGCSMTVGREVSIGNHCLVASGVHIFDSPGHPTDPVQRRSGQAPRPEDVRPVKIEDDVWLGTNATIFPGVTVGQGSVVVVGSHVMNDVPPYTIVAGNPARVIAHLSNNSDCDSSAARPLNGFSLADRKRARESPEILCEILKIICSVMGTEGLNPDDNFYDAGMTSIMALPLLIEVEDRFHINIPQEQFLEMHTARTLSCHISKVLTAR